ncbi:YdbL family protein [Sphingomonas sp. ASV193]|uniref:YdbL family protein n=1 Tax=Sphingomonas sp. ASV193 TaxID=3144405 RepID=UPI0032E8870F
MAALAAAAAVPAAAQWTPQVMAARASGAVGERFDGYLGVAGPVDEGTRRAVAVINIKRRALYSDLAAKKGVSPQEVGITAACKLLSDVAVGQSYLLGDGGWRRRAAGEAAPRPDYCG